MPNEIEPALKHDPALGPSLPSHVQDEFMNVADTFVFRTLLDSPELEAEALVIVEDNLAEIAQNQMSLPNGQLYDELHARLCGPKPMERNQLLIFMKLFIQALCRLIESVAESSQWALNDRDEFPSNELVSLASAMRNPAQVLKFLGAVKQCVTESEHNGLILQLATFADCTDLEISRILDITLQDTQRRRLDAEQTARRNYGTLSENVSQKGSSLFPASVETQLPVLHSSRPSAFRATRSWFSAKEGQRWLLKLNNAAIPLLMVVSIGIVAGSLWLWPPSGQRGKQSTVLASLTLVGRSKGADVATVHSLDKYVFEAKSQTTLPYGWLIGIDDEAAMLRQFTKNTGDEIILTHRGQFDVRDCYESFVVILSERDFEPLHDAGVGWLSNEQIIELQQIVQREPDAKEGQTVIERALRQAGLSGPMQVSVRSYRHLRDQRPLSSD